MPIASLTPELSNPLDRAIVHPAARPAAGWRGRAAEVRFDAASPPSVAPLLARVAAASKSVPLGLSLTFLRYNAAPSGSRLWAAILGNMQKELAVRCAPRSFRVPQTAIPE